MLKAIASIVSITSIILLNPTNISAQTQDFNANSYQKNTNNSLIAQTMPRLRFKLPDRGVPGARIGGQPEVATNQRW